MLDGYPPGLAALDNSQSTHVLDAVHSDAVLPHPPFLFPKGWLFPGRISARVNGVELAYQTVEPVDSRSQGGVEHTLTLVGLPRSPASERR